MFADSIITLSSVVSNSSMPWMRTGKAPWRRFEMASFIIR